MAAPATEGKQDASNTILNSILTELRDDVFVQSTIWEDRSNTTSVFFREERIRSQDDGTITTVYTRLSDNTVVGSLPAGSIPVAGATDRLIQYYRYIAVTAGTGYSVRDFVANTLIFDTGGNGAILSSIWYNLSTSNTIGTPTAAHLIDPEDWLRTAFGSQPDSPATTDTGTFPFISLFKRSLQGITSLITSFGTALTNWTTLLNRIPLLGSQTPANSLPIVSPTNSYGNPTSPTNFLPIKSAPINRFRTSFSAVIASGIDTNFWTLLITGAAQTIAQAAGSLVLNAQTTANAETIIRSNVSLLDAFIMKWGLIASQRIANNNLFIELVDVIGDNLVCTVNSPTSITVTFPGSFVPSPQNIGQFFNVQAFQGFTGVNAISGRFAVASIVGQAVTFTVAGFATGSVNTGTCSITGWNFHQVLYQGTTATNATYQTQRRGWANTPQTATILTTASPGHAGVLTQEDNAASFQDSLQTATTSIATTVRGMALQNIPDENTPLFVQIRLVNGSTAPASNTTYTLSFLGVEDYVPNLVTIANSKNQNLLSVTPVQAYSPTASNFNANVSGTVTANQGTMAALPAGTNAIGDVGQQYRASSTGAGTGTILNCPATPAAQSLKGAAGRLIGFYVMNTNAAARWLKIYNTASPTLGTTAAVLDIPIPPSNNPIFINFEGGIAFSTAIVVAVTAAQGTTNNGAVTLNDVAGFLVFA